MVHRRRARNVDQSWLFVGGRQGYNTRIIDWIELAHVMLDSALSLAGFCVVKYTFLELNSASDNFLVQSMTT